MFVDASVIVAILGLEKDGQKFLDRLQASRDRHTSVVAAFEAVIAIGRLTRDRQSACRDVEDFLSRSNIEVRDVEAGLLPRLADAHARYGKGSGHPARLNMGDCFSYAMAKRAAVPLLYKGDDFARTDLA